MEETCLLCGTRPAEIEVTYRTATGSRAIGLCRECTPGDVHTQRIPDYYVVADKAVPSYTREVAPTLTTRSAPVLVPVARTGNLRLTHPGLDFWVDIAIHERSGRYLATADLAENTRDVGVGDTPRDAAWAALRSLGEPYAREMASAIDVQKG